MPINWIIHAICREHSTPSQNNHAQKGEKGSKIENCLFQTRILYLYLENSKVYTPNPAVPPPKKLFPYTNKNYTENKSKGGGKRNPLTIATQKYE